MSISDRLDDRAAGIRRRKVGETAVSAESDTLVQALCTRFDWTETRACELADPLVRPAKTGEGRASDGALLTAREFVAFVELIVSVQEALTSSTEASRGRRTTHGRVGDRLDELEAVRERIESHDRDVVRRKELVRELLTAEVPVKDVVAASGLSRSRIYQVRDEGP